MGPGRAEKAGRRREGGEVCGEGAEERGEVERGTLDMRCRVNKKK